MRASSPFIPALQDTCEEFERSCKTLQSNLSDVAPEHMQNINTDPGNVSRVPTSGGLAGESIDSPQDEQLATGGKVSLSDEEDNDLLEFSSAESAVRR